MCGVVGCRAGLFATSLDLGYMILVKQEGLD